MGKKKRRGKRSVQLTDDLTIDIISRVPEKDLMRFTCVSKSWRFLINTDSYLSHLRSHRTTLQDRPFLIIGKGRFVSGSWLYYNYLLELDSIEDGNPNPREIHNPFDDDHDSPRRDALVIASCEGLLVLQQLSSDKMVVSNPTTKEHHVVPPNPAGDDNVKFMGFGYDPVHGCYKLVTKIKDASSHEHVLELMIYNVNNCTWKKSKFDGLSGSDYCYSPLGECVEGALYLRTNMSKILCFVLAEEEFHEVDVPEEDCERTMHVFDGRLYWVGEAPSYGENKLWLMEWDPTRRKGSSNRCLNKFLRIRELEAMLPRHIFGVSYLDLHPICYSGCRNKILFNVAGGQLFWYDLRENTFEFLQSSINEAENINVRSCVPSLVRIGTS